ncbi:MAG: hypothetical protein ACFE7R_06855, partial [Candidatus Hodarchaeota archaeon]
VLAADMTSLVIPVNDWDFLTTMSGVEEIEGLNLIETEEEWGTVATGSFESAETIINFRNEIRYEKENGTLTYLRMRYRALGNDLIDIVFVQWHQGMPTVLPPEIQLTSVLIVAVSGLAFTILAFVGYRMYKGRKSLARKLGE